jgi:hypothetical protein
VRYCTVKEVENFLNLSTLSESTSPKKSQVEMYIHQAEDEIDARTGHAWRWRRCEQNYPFPAYQFKTTRSMEHSLWFDGLIIPLTHRQVDDLSAAKGDELKLFDNGTWKDWIADYTQGINKDFWIIKEDGKLHLKRRWAMNVLDKIRITYRYGTAAETLINGTNGTNATNIRVDSTKYFQYNGLAHICNSNGTIENIYYNSVNATTLKQVSRAQEGTTAKGYSDGLMVWQVAGDIKRCAILLTSVAITHNDLLSVNISMGPGSNYEDLTRRIEQWKDEAEAIMQRHTEMVRITG